MGAFFCDVFTTFIGGLAVAAALFYLRERAYALPEISGRWYCELITEITGYNPYAGMTLRYEVILCLEGSSVYGTAEKIFESSSTQPHRHYHGSDRKRATIQGYVRKNYFGRDRVHLHIVEAGFRQSSIYQELTETTILKGVEWSGRFQSMIARQEGSTRWTRQDNGRGCC